MSTIPVPSMLGGRKKVKVQDWFIASRTFLVPLMFALCFLVVYGWGAYFNRVSVGSPTDDGLIHVRPAEMLVHHGVLSFNLSERVEASSSLLYTLIIAVGFMVGVSHLGIISYLLLVGTLFSTAVVLVLYIMLKEEGVSDGWTVFAVALAGLCPIMGYWSAGVMETPLNTFLEVGMIASVMSKHSRAIVFSLVFSALLVVCRPDGFVLPLLCSVYFVSKHSNWASAVKLMAVSIGMFLALGIFRKVYYGEFFPSPVYAKTGMPWGDSLDGAISTWNSFFVPSGMWILIFPLLGSALVESLQAVRKIFRLQHPFRHISLIPWVSVGMVVYWWIHGGDGYGVRMLLSLFPLGIFQWISILDRSGKMDIQSKARAWVLVGALIFSPLYVFPSYYDYRAQNLSPAPIITRDLSIAEVLRKNHPNIRSGTADKLGFISYAVGPDVEMYDLIGGLADPVLAHIPPQVSVTGKVITGHCKFNLDYTIGKKPDFVYMVVNSYPSLAHPFIPDLNKEYLEKRGYNLAYISSCMSYKVVDVRGMTSEKLDKFFRSSEYNIVVFLRNDVETEGKIASSK